MDTDDTLPPQPPLPPRETQIEALWLQFQAAFIQVLHSNKIIPRDCVAAATLLEAYRTEFIGRIASIPPPLPVPTVAMLRDREEAKMYALIEAYSHEFEEVPR